MMNTDHDELEDVYEEDEAPRSIFSAAWFRVVLVVLVLGVVGAIAVPYVLDVVNAPATTTARPPLLTPEGAGARSVATLSEPAKSTPVPPPKPSTPATSSSVSPAAPKAAEPAKPAPSVKPSEPVKTVEPPKRSERAKVPESASSAARSNGPPAAKSPVTRADQAAASASGDAGSGDYFVQVGAFKDERMARSVAAQLRQSNYPVSESVARAGAPVTEPPRVAAPAAATPGDRYDVLVSGGPAAEINTKLAAKGLASEPAGDGVRIRPSLPLRDAVALSKDLGNQGFRVQVRRGGANGEPLASAPSTESAALYRVRVGGYPNRAAAQTVVRELRDKGYEPFIAKGRD